VIGRDDNAILIGQVFERSSSAGAQNEIIAEAVIRVRFLRGGGGTVPPKEIRQLAGASDTLPELEPWIAVWNRNQVQGSSGSS